MPDHLGRNVATGYRTIVADPPWHLRLNAERFYAGRAARWHTFSAPSRCDLTVRERLQWIRDEFPPPPKPERTY